MANTNAVGTFTFTTNGVDQQGSGATATAAIDISEYEGLVWIGAVIGHVEGTLPTLAGVVQSSADAYGSTIYTLKTSAAATTANAAGGTLYALCDTAALGSSIKLSMTVGGSGTPKVTYTYQIVGQKKAV